MGTCHENVAPESSMLAPPAYAAHNRLQHLLTPRRALPQHTLTGNVDGAAVSRCQGRVAGPKVVRYIDHMDVRWVLRERMVLHQPRIAVHDIVLIAFCTPPS